MAFFFFSFFLFKLASFEVRGKPWTKRCPRSPSMLMSLKSMKTCFLSLLKVSKLIPVRLQLFHSQSRLFFRSGHWIMWFSEKTEPLGEAKAFVTWVLNLSS